MEATGIDHAVREGTESEKNQELMTEARRRSGKNMPVEDGTKGQNQVQLVPQEQEAGSF